MSQKFNGGDGDDGYSGGSGDSTPPHKNDMGKVNNGPFITINGIPIANVKSWSLSTGPDGPTVKMHIGHKSTHPSLPLAIRELYAITDSRVATARKSHANEKPERIYSHIAPQHLFPRPVVEVMAISGRSGSVVFMRPVPSLAAMIHGHKVPRGVSIRNDRIGDPRDVLTGDVVFRPHVIHDDAASDKAEKVYVESCGADGGSLNGAHVGGCSERLWNFLECVYYERFGPPREHGVCN